MKCKFTGCNKEAWFTSDLCQVHHALHNPNRPVVEAVVKDTNPKDAIGATKLPMHLIPGSAKAHMALAFLEGALKYGKYNWRVAGVRASIYLDAMERHLEKWKNGEEVDPLTGVPHLASVMACSAIILDARAVGKLNDDRPPAAPVSKLIDDLAPYVRYLQSLYEDESPHQYTIEDSQWQHESNPKPTTTSTTERPKPRSSEQPGIKHVETPSEKAEFIRAMERK